MILAGYPSVVITPHDAHDTQCSWGRLKFFTLKDCIHQELCEQGRLFGDSKLAKGFGEKSFVCIFLMIPCGIYNIW